MRRRIAAALICLVFAGCLTPLTSRLDRTNERAAAMQEQLVIANARLAEATGTLERSERKLAEAKARKDAGAFDDAVVVSGDAVVAKHSKIFEEPRSNQEAVEFLRELSGSAFLLVTSLTCFVRIPAECSALSKLPRSNFVAWQTVNSTTTSADIRFCAARELSRATAFCASLTPSRAATTSSPRCP